MSSQVEICNLALMSIGVKPIAAMAEASEPARRCNLVWTSTLEDVLRDHDWNFARREEVLALVSGASVTGWDYIYAYPSNCVAPRKIYESGQENVDPPVDFEVMSYQSTNQKIICTNIETAYCKYTAKVDDTTLYDPEFVKALAFGIAASVAYALTSNRALSTDMANAYGNLISRAKATNKNEGAVRKDQYSDYINVRG